MTRWWLSWVQNGDDCRPVAWPPPPNVLAFWESGWMPSVDGVALAVTVVALVEAADHEAARAIIELAWNPGVGEWRFCNEYGKDQPPGDRFPPPDWSLEQKRWPWPEIAADDIWPEITDDA